MGVLVKGGRGLNPPKETIGDASASQDGLERILLGEYYATITVAGNGILWKIDNGKPGDGCN